MRCELVLLSCYQALKFLFFVKSFIAWQWQTHWQNGDETQEIMMMKMMVMVTQTHCEHHLNDVNEIQR